MRREPGKGRAFPVSAEVRAVRIPGFRPGFDECRVRVTRAQTTLLSEMLPDGTALVLRTKGEDERVVTFPGLSMLPLGDIVLELDTSDGVRDIALADLDAVPSPSAPTTTPRRRPITEFAVRPGDPIPSFSAFRPGHQLIEVAMPGRIAADARIDVRPSPDGRDGILLIDGKAAAVLAGAPSATPADIRLLGSDGM